MQDVTSIEVDGVTYYNHKGETWEDVCNSSLGESDHFNHKTLPSDRHAKTFAQFINGSWKKVVIFEGALRRMDDVIVRFYYFDKDEKPIEICANQYGTICNIAMQHEYIKNKPFYYTENQQTPSRCSMQGGKGKRKSNRKRQQRRTKRRQQKSKRRQRK